MKKLTSILLTLSLLLSLAACGGNQSDSADSEISTSENNIPESSTTTDFTPENNVEIKTSPDKYTWYVKNYVGKNMASVGYTSMMGNRMEAYGDGYIELIPLSVDGDFVDISSNDTLKNWWVIGQNLAPNTEIKYTYAVDSDGEEYSNLIDHQSIEKIVLAVAPVGQKPDIPVMTAINPSPDKYTSYIGDYVGRTLAHCGYISIMGHLMDQYNNAYVQLSVYSDDGSYIDYSDINTLKNYMVTSQSIAPNAELKMTYMLDSDGKEYDSLIDTQNIEEIELYVRKVNDYKDEPAADEAVEETVSSENYTENESDLSDEVSPEFKAAMDSYEEFFDEYIEFMTEYNDAEPSEMINMLAEYTEFMTDFAEAMAELEDLDEDDMSSEEALYYAEVMLRINEKLLAIE